MKEINIELAYIRHDKKQYLLSCKVKSPCTIKDAIEQSGLLELCPELNLNETLQVGIFSEKRSLNEFLTAEDRIEIYRDLIIDPKDRRRKKARCGT